MSDLSAEPLDNAEPSDAPRPVLIVVATLALIALAVELYVGVTSAFAPAIAPQVAIMPAETASPSSAPIAPTLPAQTPPAG